jgi:diguanylate cyclase (GGDEF)-like protein
VRQHPFLRVVAVAVCYWAAARLALAAAVVDGNAAPLWPPIGIALVAVLRGGRGMWPAVLIGELAVELTSGVAPLVSLATAGGNVAEVLIAAWLFERLGGRRSLRTVRDVFALGAGAGVLAGAVSATVGVGALVAGGALPAGSAVTIWQTWWLGNLGGVLIVTPVLLTLGRPSMRASRRALAEAGALAAASGLVAVWALSADQGQPYIVFPLLALAGLRFGPGAAALANLFVAGICVWCAARGLGPFTSGTDGDGLRQSQEFLITMAVTSLLLAVTTTEVRAHRRRLARLVDEQAAVARIATLTAAGAPIDAILAEICDQVTGVLGIGQAAVVRRAGPDRIRVIARSSTRPAVGREVGSLVELVPGGAVAIALDEGRLGVLDERDSPAPTMPPIVQRIAVPIRVDGQTWGAVAAASDDPRHAIGPAHEHALTAMAEIAAVAVTAAETRAHLVRQAMTDPLTGLADHGSLQRHLRREYDLSVRHQHAVALVLLDLDGFKQVNDVVGHAEGDEVLRRTARCLETHLRQGDLLARLGGDELAILLPHTDADGALALAERMRAALADAELTTYAHVTASFGLSVSSGAASVEALLRQADAALLESKAHGGNAVTRYRPHMSSESDAQRRERIDRTRTLAAVRAMARAIDARDSSTTRHSEGVADLAARLAAACGWTARDVARLRQAALVHDVGKLGVRDAVLFKPGPLTPEERIEIQRHAALGADIVAEVLDPEQVSWIRGHHERPDGSGYPDRLAGDSIPAGAALLAIADAWDAMTSARPYSRPRSVPDALLECRAHAGSQFASWAVDAVERLYGAESVRRVA